MCPAETAAFLAGRVVLAPGVAALQTAQDRMAEKTFISGLGLPVAPFAAVSDLDRELEARHRPDRKASHAEDPALRL